MASSGISATSASRIIVQWATWRRKACEQMLLDHDYHDHDSILAPGSLQAVRTASQGKGATQVKKRDMRDPPRLCGQQRRRHIVAQELQGLSEHRAVSAFAHRNCIESFLRCKFFFGTGWPVHDDERSVSMATKELATTPSVQQWAVQNSAAHSEHHGFRDEVVRDHHHHFENAPGNHEVHAFQSTEDESLNVENTLRGTNEDLQDDIDHEQMTRHDDEYSDSGSSEQGSEQSGSSSATLYDNTVRQGAGTYWQPNEVEGGALLDVDDDVFDSQEAAEPRLQPDQNFYSPTYRIDHLYLVELPELLSRGSVSNLFRSGFGESLDQLLMQSYAGRQEFVEREMLNTAASVTEHHVDHAINEPNTAEHDRPWIVSSGQGARRRQWYWTRPEFVLDAIQELEIVMVGIYRGMERMQQMVEECLEMQMEVQRSIKQEVSAAMNRYRGVQGSDEGQLDGPSRWHLGHLVRKGTCCICSDNQIDSVMYRCGHMCTCSKCARELLNGDGKCPMCRAPIVDVVQAYTA